MRQSDVSEKIGMHGKRRPLDDLFHPIPEVAVCWWQLPERLTPKHDAHGETGHVVPQMRRGAMSAVTPPVDRRDQHAGCKQEPVYTEGPTCAMSQEPDRVAK